MKLIRSENKKKPSDEGKESQHSANGLPASIHMKPPKGALDSKRWKMLIVDDEPDVHEITRIALKGFTFEGKKLELISAYSAEQAKKILAIGGR